MFKARCKLYRFKVRSKEWKEKGVGEIKVLRNKEHSNIHRVLMRRDQVLKLCASHWVISGLAFEQINEKLVRWLAADYSECSGKHKYELDFHAARFKHESEAFAFKKGCEDALEILKKEPITPVATKVASSSAAKSVAFCKGFKSIYEIISCVQLF